MLTGQYPYIAKTDLEILGKIRKGPPVFASEFNISDDSKDFILKCLTIDPKKRINWS